MTSICARTVPIFHERQQQETLFLTETTKREIPKTLRLEVSVRLEAKVTRRRTIQYWTKKTGFILKHNCHPPLQMFLICTVNANDFLIIGQRCDMNVDAEVTMRTLRGPAQTIAVIVPMVNPYHTVEDFVSERISFLFYLSSFHKSYMLWFLNSNGKRGAPIKFAKWFTMTLWKRSMVTWHLAKALNLLFRGETSGLLFSIWNCLLGVNLLEFRSSLSNCSSLLYFARTFTVCRWFLRSQWINSRVFT